MPDIYSQLRDKKLAEEQEKAHKQASLEKQLKMWQKRREELRGITATALDPTYIRRSIDKCSREIDKILKML